MIKSYRNVLKFSLIILILLFVNVIVYGKEYTEISTGRYSVEERIMDNILPYDIKHFKDLSTSSFDSNQTIRNQQVNVLTIPSNLDIKVTPWAYIQKSRWNLAPVTKIITDYEANNPGYKVIAAVNGDFFDINAKNNFPYVPEGVHAANGNFYKSSFTNSVGFKNDGSKDSLIGNEAFERSAKMQLDIYNDNNEVIYNYEIDKINEKVEDNEIAIFYANYDKNHNVIPLDVEDGVIIEDAEYALPIAENDFYGLGTISKIGDATLGNNQFAIMTNNPELTEKLKLGVKIRTQFVGMGAYEGVEDIVGVRETILFDREFVGRDVNTHPRTMVGVADDGSIIFTVVDGRQESKGMVGVTSVEMAAILTHYGAIEGYNLDGGGSSTMVIFKDGKLNVVNSPSGGVQRSDANGIMVAAKVPIIDYSVTNINIGGFTINANVVDKNGYQLDKLYVGVEDTIKEVVNGKVVFTDLDVNKEYVYTFYSKVNNEFESLIIEDYVYTAKRMPVINFVDLYYDNDTVVVAVDIIDPDNAITKQMAYLDDNFSGIIEGKANFYNFTGKLDDLQINYNHDLNDGNGEKNIKMINFKTRCNLNIFMQIINDKINRKINSLLG